MPVESAADREMFLAAADFGLAATYTPAGGGPARTVNGIFDASWTEIEVGAEVGISTTGPRILVRTQDLVAGGKVNDIWMINGTGYLSVDNQHDGTGMTNVRLHKS